MGHGNASEDRLEINLTPLLDLVLQLIMFFMLTVNFVRADQVSDGIDLPVAQSAMPVQCTEDNLVHITIGSGGQRSAGGTKLDTAAEFRNFLRSRRDEMDRLARERGLTGPATMIVVVRAHKDAPWGDVWDTLDECSRAGCHSWQLRVIKQA